MKPDLWRLGHAGQVLNFPSLAMLRTYVMFLEQFRNWPWTETRLVDAGACVGSFSLAALQAFPAAQVHAFEPWPENWQWLMDNLRATGSHHWSAFKLALSSEPGQRMMYYGPRWGMSSLHGQGAGSLVEARCLDEVLDEPVSLMKLDVEGHELEVLRGAQRIISRDHPRLIVELRRDLQAQGGHAAGEVESYLAEQGYHSRLPLTKQDYLFSTEKVNVA